MQDRLFIDGQWVPALRGGRLPLINPATEERFHEVAAGTAEDIDLAVAAARRAFDGGWRHTSGRQRAGYLRGIAHGIRERLNQLSALETQNNGKPLPEAQWDVGDAAACFEYYAGLAEELDSRQEEMVALPDARFHSHIRHEPIGVAGAIIPWNYPLLMAAWKVAPALAAGCTLVLKPSELTPVTALEMGVIADEIGLPKGVLNIVTGRGTAAGASLSSHPGIDKVAFTGSTQTGKRIMIAAAQDIKNVSLELGGKSPLIVFADSDIDDAVEWIMFGIFWNQGQVCSATSRVLIERPIYEKLVEALAKAANSIVIGDGNVPGVKLGPLVSADQYQKVLRIIQEGRQSGARLVAGGKRPLHLPTGFFLEPTIFAEPPIDSLLWREEIFGPVVCLRPFDTEAEAISEANKSVYGLAAAVMSKDMDRCARVANRFEAGIVWINCSQPTFVEAPWGGYKKSGIGRELGRWGLENYLEVKQVTTYVGDKPWGWYGN